MLLMGIVCTVGAMRPDRDPAIMSWLYDFAFLSFEGTMGVFLIGSLVWMAAVLLDQNRVFPRWFGYLNLCNALTEVVVAPAWIFKSGAFAWDGAIAWWINMGVFVTYTTVFLTLLRRLILREDFGTGPLPEVARMSEASRERIEEQRFVPGQPDMWAFVLFEALVFTAYFLVYVVCRSQNLDLFLRRRRTWTCASASSIRSSCWPAPGPWRAASRPPASDSYRAALTNAFLTMLFGFVFLVSKVARVGGEDRRRGSASPPTSSSPSTTS